MPGNTAGFSLVEALISVLVLSIGVLGLARLQASLWSAAGDLHADRHAYGFGVAELEKSLFRAVTANTGGEPVAGELLTPATRFRGSTSYTAAHGQAVSATVMINWNTRSGPHTLVLETATSADWQPADTRWLLPSDALVTAYPPNPSAHPRTAENQP